MLNSISRLGETRPEQEWSNGTEFSGYYDFPEKRVHSKRIPKFSKTFPGIFTVPFNFEPEISEILAEWKAPQSSLDSIVQMSEGVICRLQVAGCRLQVAGCRLQVAGCRCRLQVAGQIYIILMNINK